MRDEVDEIRLETPSRQYLPLTEVTAGQGRYVVPFTLSREEKAVGMETARSHLTQLMAECAASSCQSKDESSWIQVNKTRKKATKVFVWEKRLVDASNEVKRKKRGSSVLRRLAAIDLDEDKKSLTYCVRSTTMVNAPLSTVLKILDASVATAYRSFTRIIYGNLVADTSVLFHTSTPGTSFWTESDSDSYETLAVRWLVCRCSNPMVSDCDFCLQEYTKRHSIDELSMNSSHYNNNKRRDDDEDEDDTRAQSPSDEGLHAIDEMPVAYKIFRSMETRHCPELLESHRVVRCKVPLGGFLLYPTDNSDKTAVVFYMSIAQSARRDRDDPSGSLLTQCSDRQFRALQSVVRQMALQIGRLDKAVESYNMVLHLESLRNLQWVRNAERIQCVVCCRRFHQLTRRRHHCRLCGEVICRECSILKDVDLPTFGPTMLRVCTTCNQNHSSWRLKASSRSESEQSVSSPNPRRRRRILLTPDHDTDKSKLETGTLAKNRGDRRQSMLEDEGKREKKRSHESSKRKFAVALDNTQRLKSGEQASSCPKPVSFHTFEREDFTHKWRNTRRTSTKEPSLFTTSFTSPKAIHTFNHKVGIHRSSSETFSTSLHPQRPLFDKCFHSPTTTRKQVRLNPRQAQINDNDEEDKYESLDIGSHDKSGLWSRDYQPSPMKQDNNEENKHFGSRMTAESAALLTDRPWIYRTFESPQMYEDIFLTLCENAASVRNSEFVALTLFTRTFRDNKNQQDEAETEEVSVSYLKVRGHAKLMKVAANLRCCDPVLWTKKPLVTRNVWVLNSQTSIHPSGYDFRQLPIVLGPQQAKFYAGVPLTDTKKGFRYGALAVFDSRMSRGEDDDLPMKKTLQALHVCTREAVMAVDERRKEIELRTFLQAPLIQLRQSEPALYLNTDASQSSLQCRDIESLDGDSDDNDGVDEDYQRHASVSRKGSMGFPHSGNSSVGRARVDYFQRKMQELVRQAQDTQAQMVENTLFMERHGVPIV